MFEAILIIFIIYSLILNIQRKKNEIKYIYIRELPTNDAPAFVGKIIKGHTNGNDIIATLLDLSYKNYIKFDTEEINGKDKKIIYLLKNSQINLEEHEQFLINKLFKSSDKIVFDDYIASKEFKKDFLTFDKMLERKIERKSIYKSSILKNINKIIFLICFLVLGITLFYSIFLPITMGISNFFEISIENKLKLNIVFSSIIYIIISYKYVSYINKSTNARENMNLNITYIIFAIIIGTIISFNKTENIMTLFISEFTWYKIIINFIIAIITFLYMFNMIKHTEKEEYIYYIFIIFGIISILTNLKISMCISILFFAIYNFFKSTAFKKYLEDYSLLSDQDENAILIWEKYLIYAISLGINKKIIRKYGTLSNSLIIDEKYLKRFYIEYIE